MSSFIASRTASCGSGFVLEVAGRGVSTSKLVASSFLYSSSLETAAELLTTKSSKMFSLFVARTDTSELNKVEMLSKISKCSKA